jgi:hypothetical protein
MKEETPTNVTEYSATSGNSASTSGGAATGGNIVNRTGGGSATAATEEDWRKARDAARDAASELQKRVWVPRSIR